MFSTNTKRLLKSFIAVFTIDCFPPSCDICKSELVLSLVYFHELTTLSTTAILLLANVFSICNLCYARNNLSSLFQPPRFSFYKWLSFWFFHVLPSCFFIFIFSSVNVLHIQSLQIIFFWSTCCSQIIYTSAF